MRELRKRGVPVDATGHEMHNSINYPTPEAVKQAVNTVAENFPGIDQQVTELDVSVYNAETLRRTMATVFLRRSWPNKAGSMTNTSASSAS